LKALIASVTVMANSYFSPRKTKLLSRVASATWSVASVDVGRTY